MKDCANKSEMEEPRVAWSHVLWPPPLNEGLLRKVAPIFDADEFLSTYEAFVWVCGAFVAQKQVLHEHNRGSEFSRTSRRRDKLLVQRQQLAD